MGLLSALKNGKIAKYLTVGFSYLMAIYAKLSKAEDGKFYVELPTRKIEILDDVPYLEYFVNGGKIIDFMKDANVWGEDLTDYKGFAETVLENVDKIYAGEKLI